MVCLSLLLIFDLVPLGQARTYSYYPWPEQLGKADVVVVCLGTVTSTEISKWRGGQAEATVQVNVLRVLKGPALLKQLTFTEVLEQDEPNPEVPAAKYAIFFFRGQADEERTDENWFQLFMPHQSIITIGNTLPKLPSSKLPPFRTVGLLMAGALANADEERRGDLLDSLQEAIILEITTNPELSKLKHRLGEPNEVHQFYDEQIIPLVEPYLKDPNAEVRRVAGNIVSHRR